MIFEISLIFYNIILNLLTVDDLEPLPLPPISEEKEVGKSRKHSIHHWISFHLGQYFFNLKRQTHNDKKIEFNFNLRFAPVVVDKIVAEYSRHHQLDHDRMRKVLEEGLTKLAEKKEYGYYTVKDGV